MPELPEVEIAREQLEGWLVGRTIRSARAPDRLLRGGGSRPALEAALRGAKARSIERRGKFLVMDIGARRPRVLAHLGMTGKFLRLERDEPVSRFARVELFLAGGARVVLDDARRLGRFQLLDAGARARLDRLGLEPLARELSGRCLHTLLAKSKAPIKLFLMDQSKVAGLGNIQVAEALFLAGLHPARQARTLDVDDASRLVRAIKKALRAELGRYRSSRRYLYEGAENHFLVYDREGEPCVRCGAQVKRVVQGARSTYYCPSCQKRGASR